MTTDQGDSASLMLRPVRNAGLHTASLPNEVSHPQLIQQSASPIHAIERKDMTLIISFPATKQTSLAEVGGVLQHDTVIERE
jgi:hypothetical protein